MQIFSVVNVKLLQDQLCMARTLQMHLRIIFESLFWKHSQQTSSLIRQFIIELILYINKFKYQMYAKVLLFFVSLLNVLHAYVEVQISINRTNDSVSYLVPIKINDIPYSLSVSMQNSKEFIIPISQKIIKKKNKHKSSLKQLNGVISGFSIQGYSLEGWKRIFLEALLFIQSHYHHLIYINLTEFHKQNSTDLTHKQDGVISFGPNIEENVFFKILKQSSHIQEDIISIYRKSDDNHVRIQFGGIQYQYAKGHKDGYKFYSLNLIASQGKWKIPIQSIQCSRKSHNWNTFDVFNIVNSGSTYAISISSPLLRLPSRLSLDIERSFESAHTTCKITQNHRLSCTNISNMELMINKIHFYINDGGYINISLWDLIQNQNQQRSQTFFNIQFVQNESDFQIGQALFRSYYVSLDMSKKKMMYSPINHSPSPNVLVYFIRFILLFIVFTIFTTVFVFFWQLCDPTSKTKINFLSDFKKHNHYHKAIGSEDLE